MKRIFFCCAAFGIVFSFLAWLLGILIIDAFIGPEDWSSVNEGILVKMEEQLNSAADREASIALLSNTFLANITEMDRNELSENQRTKDIYYDLILGDGTLLSVGLNERDISFVTYADWLQLILYCLASISAIWITLITFERELRQLNSAAKNIMGNDISAVNVISTYDPIPVALNALESAKKQIAQLKDAEKTAVEHHRDLLSSVAHEFRNPLARLQFAIELAAERTGDDQSALFDEANIAAVELDSLVRETLNYSRLVNNGGSLTFDTVSIIDVFRVLSELQPGTRPEIELRLDYPHDEILLFADKRLLTRALTNLVTNALKYAKRKVTVSVNIVELQALIGIIDDGFGIDPMQAERIFEPFYRIESSRARDTGGFGLGLSIVKSICERHNATILLQPSDTGAHFLLSWPLAETS